MLSMALELASEDPAYEDVASKFFEHFVAITDAMNASRRHGLWDDEDGFYYDQLRFDGQLVPLRIRSMVGIIPLFVCGILEDSVIDRLPGFRKRLQWFIDNRPELAQHIVSGSFIARTARRSAQRWRAARGTPAFDRVTRAARSARCGTCSTRTSSCRRTASGRCHASMLTIPYVLEAMGTTYSVDYAPGESTSGLFGGNSNWRGPVWFPLNYLLIEALERYHLFYGDGSQGRMSDRLRART